MATRFIPVSICSVPDIVRRRISPHLVQSTGQQHLCDAEVISALNERLDGTGFQVQPLEAAQFVTAPPRHNHHRAGKSPRAVARAKARVARMQKKGGRSR